MLCPATANSCDPSGLKGLSLIWAPFSLILGVALLPLVIWSAPCPCDVDMHEWGTSSLTWVSLQPGVHALGLLMSLTAPAQCCLLHPALPCHWTPWRDFTWLPRLLSQWRAAPCRCLHPF